MGLDITITREEILSNDYQKGESIIKTNIMYQTKGWELGDFLIETFDLENCVSRIIEPEETLRLVKRELKDLDYQPKLSRHISQDWVDGYEEDLKNMVAVLTEAVDEVKKGEVFGEWKWELWW